jgi:ribosome maturation factor RimP
MGSVSGPPAEARFAKETGAAAGLAALVEPVLESLGFRLVLVRILQGQGTIVEVMAERPDGSMTIEDCRTVSLGLSPVLDVHDPVPGSYRLQISSPGIDRPLVRPADFDRWAGFEARIELKEMIDGRRRFRGILEGFEDGEIRIEVDLGKDQGVKVLGLPIGLVGEAKLVLTDALVRESLQRTKRALAAAEADVAGGAREAAGARAAGATVVMGATEPAGGSGRNEHRGRGRKARTDWPDRADARQPERRRAKGGTGRAADE